VKASETMIKQNSRLNIPEFKFSESSTAPICLAFGQLLIKASITSFLASNGIKIIMQASLQKIKPAGPILSEQLLSIYLPANR
jgi:hypothetical protein